MDYAEIKAAVRHVAPGPRIVEADDSLGPRPTVFRVVPHDEALRRRAYTTARPQYIATVYSREEADFIAVCDRDAVLAMLAEIERLTAERDAERALREDAETRAKVCEENHAGYIAKLRDEKLSAESALRTMVARVEEVVAQRDAAIALAESRPAITPEDAAQLSRWIIGEIMSSDSDFEPPQWAHRVIDALEAALRAHAEKAVPR